MFNFFITLYLSIVNGSWLNNVSTNGIFNNAKTFVNSLPIWNMFTQTTNTPIADFTYINDFMALIVATICSVGVFFIIVKAIKKLFTCFLDF